MTNQQELETTSDDESCYTESDDSQDDPTFSEVELTRLNLSNLSIEKPKKPRDRTEEPEDQKSYEAIQKIIYDGNVEKLKVDQCKVYLRKHGLRLSGNKDTLIQRIKEHNNIVTGGGEEKYPASSFVLNCKGDACTGDVVIFEQNVYDMFNIASRSATGPPCGTRLVAGRTVKESYGVAKQQHTFTPTFGVGSGINPHAMNFSGDAYGMPDHPKKASVPNWLREEIIKNKAVITGKRFRKRLLFKNFS